MHIKYSFKIEKRRTSLINFQQYSTVRWLCRDFDHSAHIAASWHRSLRRL